MTGVLPTVAFVGTGVMGASMAGHLLDAGYPIVAHNRSRARAEDLISRGARWADTPGDSAAQADVTITIVGYPHDVSEVYLGDGGILERARPGSLVIDMTTSTPTLAVTIAGRAAARQVAALDAPVSGGDIGAREARLTIMCGGSAEAFARAMPLFEIMGRSVNHMGGPGAGQHTKMANQIKIAGVMLGMVESLAYAKAAGLDLEAVHRTLAGGSANSWSWENYVPRILAGDMAPGFFVKHYIKDLRIAIDEAHRMGLTLPGLDLAETLYVRLAEEIEHEGVAGGDLGTQALWLLYERENSSSGQRD